MLFILTHSRAIKKRSSNQSKTFIGRNDTISSGFTGQELREKKMRA